MSWINIYKKKSRMKVISESTRVNMIIFYCQNRQIIKDN